MTENKSSTYDEHDPPLVPATLLRNDKGLLADSSLASSPRETESSAAPPQDQDEDVPDVPQPSYQDTVVMSSTPRTSQDSAGQTQSQRTNPKVASGAAGAVIGFLFGGPILAALLGFGAAYATQKEGATGDAARALGDVAISTKEKALEVDKKHNVVNRSKEAAADVWGKAKKYDQQYNVLDKMKDVAVFSWKSFTDFIRDRRVLERGVDGVGRGYEYVSKKVSGESNDTMPPPPNTKQEKS
jgi:hypothetical protein